MERTFPHDREQQRGRLQVQTRVDVAVVVGAQRLFDRCLQPVDVDVDVGAEFGVADREDIVGGEDGERGYRSPNSSKGARNRSRARPVSPSTSDR